MKELKKKKNPLSQSWTPGTVQGALLAKVSGAVSCKRSGGSAAISTVSWGSLHRALHRSGGLGGGGRHLLVFGSLQPCCGSWPWWDRPRPGSTMCPWWQQGRQQGAAVQWVNPTVALWGQTPVGAGPPSPWELWGGDPPAHGLCGFWWEVTCECHWASLSCDDLLFCFKILLCLWIWTVWLGLCLVCSVCVFLLGVHWASWKYRVITFSSNSFSAVISSVLVLPLSLLSLEDPHCAQWCTHL